MSRYRDLKQSAASVKALTITDDERTAIDDAMKQAQPVVGVKYQVKADVKVVLDNLRNVIRSVRAEHTEERHQQIERRRIAELHGWEAGYWKSMDKAIACGGGYLGDGESTRAERARRNGLLPRVECERRLGVARGTLRRKNIEPDEWHHVDTKRRKFDRVDFFDVEETRVALGA